MEEIKNGLIHQVQARCPNLKIVYKGQWPFSEHIGQCRIHR